MSSFKILQGDCIEMMRKLPEKSVDCCVTSPPYFGLRDYGVSGQIGLENTPEQFIVRLVDVFREVKRVLKDDGTLWINMGDSYAGGGGGNYNKTGISKAGGQHVTNVRNKPSWLTSCGLKSKDLIGIPWMLAFALRADGWYLRQDIIWHKPNPMPESVSDRCTKSHEYIFLLTKSPKYHFDADAIRTPLKTVTQKRVLSGRNCERANISKDGAQGIKVEKIGTRFAPEKGANKRSVWKVATHSYKEAHFATYPPELILPCILAGCPESGTVLDPFGGSGTTAQVAIENNRNAILCELNSDYVKIIEKRLSSIDVLFNSHE